jgi:hypothetical protein
MLSTRYIGWCPVCERDIKVRSNLLVHHGYQRPGVGYIIGDCPSVGYEPYELGTGAAEHYLRTSVVPSTRQARLNLDVLQSPAGPEWLLFADYNVSTRRVTRDRFGNPNMLRLSRAEADERAAQLPEWERRRYDWDYALQAEIREQSARLEHWNRERHRIERLIAEWRPQPLRTVEEEIQRQEQSRNEREAARTAARDQKITAEVVKIRKRIDSAVRNRNSSVLADIFKSNKLRAVSGWRISRENALALLERDAIWRAFGLLTPSGYLPEATAANILDRMEWGTPVPPPPGSGLRFDYGPFPWPAELGGGVAKTRR